MKYFKQIPPAHFLPQGCINCSCFPLSLLHALNPFSWHSHGSGWCIGTGEQACASSRWPGKSGAGRSWFHCLQMEKAALWDRDLLQFPFPLGMWEIVCDLLWPPATCCTCSDSDALGHPLPKVKPLLLKSSHSSSSWLLVTSLLIFFSFYYLFIVYYRATVKALGVWHSGLAPKAADGITE